MKDNSSVEVIQPTSLQAIPDVAAQSENESIAGSTDEDADLDAADDGAGALQIIRQSVSTCTLLFLASSYLLPDPYP